MDGIGVSVLTSARCQVCSSDVHVYPFPGYQIMAWYDVWRVYAMSGLGSFLHCWMVVLA